MEFMYISRRWHAAFDRIQHCGVAVICALKGAVVSGGAERTRSLFLINAPADANEETARVAYGELEGAPRLHVRSASFDNKIAYLGSHCLNIVDIQIQAEGVVLDILGPTRCVGKVEVPTSTVRQNAVVAIIADHVEAEPPVECLAGIEVAGGDNCNRPMIHH